MSASVFRTILVVDDDEYVVAAFRRFAGDDIRVLTARTRGEALSLANEEHPDLAIVDLRLGQESGLDVLRDLLAAVPTITAVMVSGYMSVAAAVAAMKAGATSILFKPVTPREILQHVAGSDHANDGAGSTPTLARAEWEHINRVLVDCDGNVSEAARRLGIYRQSLQRKLRKYAPRE